MAGLDLAWRHDLADLDAGHLHAPALGDLVQLGAQHLVDLLALGQHVVQRDVADDRAQGGGGDALRGAGEVAHLEHAQARVDDLPVDQEVDVDRRVVLGDAGLARDLQEVLPQVEPAPPGR